MFNKIETGIEGLFVMEPKVFGDERGHFFESYSQRDFDSLGVHYRFIQDNQSKSKYGVIRGLHFQLPPYTQAKLVRVTQGAVYDVAVDIRQGSPTYGKYFGVELSDTNYKQLMIPKGFAHGFAVLSEFAIFNYKCDEYYFPKDEGGVIFDDVDINIDWRIPVEMRLVSDKDKKWSSLKELNNPFYYGKI